MTTTDAAATADDDSAFLQRQEEALTRTTAVGCCTGKSLGTPTAWNSATAASIDMASPPPR